MRRYEPMLLKEVTELPLGPEWGYEDKFDGYRMEADISIQGVKLISRGGHDITFRFPAVASQLPEAFGGHSAVVDGELIGFDANGRQDFNVLGRRDARTAYVAFDLLEIDGKPIIDQPLQARRDQLDDIFVPKPKVQQSPVFDDRDAMLQAAVEMGLEGVVAKNRDSVYEPGKRSRNWQKQILVRHTEGFRH